MKVIAISKRGVGTVKAHPMAGKAGGHYYCVLHGEQGRGRWQLRLPLAVREYPCTADSKELPLTGEFKLVPLGKQDPKGNPLFLLSKGAEDGKILVLWDLHPGFRGGAKYTVSGKATVIALGEEAQGIAGRMGGADCPLVLVEGPCVLTWHRSGRLYGEAADWVASFDGQGWTVAPVHDCAIETAAQTY